MEIRGLAFVPLLWISWTLLGLVVLVTLTLISGHENYPSISDTGKDLPESALYKVIFIVSSILGVGLCSIQYRFMILKSDPSEKLHISGQRVLYALGWISCITTTLSALCSLKTDATVHRIGTLLALTSNSTYNLCQAAVLYKRSFSSRRMCHITMASASGTMVALILLEASQIFLLLDLVPDDWLKIFSYFSKCLDYLVFAGLTLHQVTNCTDFQRLSLRLSREGVSIYLREKPQDPENPV
ncbi:DNA damage-regulated autophagy modulator protein 1-like isoform X1 [Engystomops pustulosus]|uniref:DNA damage-regulated autophagy modulator protein 1-like isoform X1 n=1 Tax=Engystomops pustulosus TaxID=76066 RepID=UPI003AFB2A46